MSQHEWSVTLRSLSLPEFLEFLAKRWRKPTHADVDEAVRQELWRRADDARMERSK